ncbi:uncharacterized protein LOC113326709 isoform X2 [Papaver somniferum]|uniref:uncharacterized protein LOC113326709 isoform X2 n=1 Tax=Papaver somniferum TaxID=3469 RepID=UPI000E703C32|nr:uncharacterized protein LOC113326709 isoform X2 [Papaver somniferum]
MFLFSEIDASDSGLNTSNRCFQITISSQEEDDEETSKVLLALVFAHTEKHPDEPPLLHVKSLKGISLEHLQALKQKLEEEYGLGIMNLKRGIMKNVMKNSW